VIDNGAKIVIFIEFANSQGKYFAEEHKY